MSITYKMYTDTGKRAALSDMYRDCIMPTSGSIHFNYRKIH